MHWDCELYRAGQASCLPVTAASSRPSWFIVLIIQKLQAGCPENRQAGGLPYIRALESES
jgi:hypothetical protein